MRMSGITALARSLQNLDEQLAECSRCGMCQAACPLYAETGRESDVARGKLALLDGLKEEMFSNPDGVMDRLNRCLLCGSCQAGCSCEVNVLEIFMKARVILAEYKGLSLLQKIILRHVLSRPGRFDRLLKLAADCQRLFIKTANTSQATSCARIAVPIPSERHVTPLAGQPFHERRPFVDSPPGKSGVTVGFFPGCLLDKVFPHVADAVLNVLDHHGVGVFMPESQGCCGIPAISTGDINTFNVLVEHNLNLFEAGRFDYLVTACATCTFTIKKVWPALVDTLPPAIQESVRALAQKTLDISDFLVSMIGISASGEVAAGAETVTYHDPCHLKQSLGVYREPRELIRANPACRFSEMPEPDTCCGMGGNFNLKYYDVSSKIGEKKRQHIMASACGIVATGCPACMMQMSDMLSRHNDPVRVKHVIELYHESIVRRATDKNCRPPG